MIEGRAFMRSSATMQASRPAKGCLGCWQHTPRGCWIGPCQRRLPAAWWTHWLAGYCSCPRRPTIGCGGTYNMRPSLGCSPSHPCCRCPGVRPRQASEGQASRKWESDVASGVPGPHSCGLCSAWSAAGRNVCHWMRQPAYSSSNFPMPAAL